MHETDHQKEHTGIVATCSTCGVQIRGSLRVSSNFISHLKRHHPQLYQDFLKQKEFSHGAATRKSSTSQRTSPYPPKGQITGNILKPDNKDKFQHNVLQFLIATNQPLSLVDDVYFLRLFGFNSNSRKSSQYAEMITDECKYKQLELANFFSNSKQFIGLTADAWTFGNCKYIAVSSHWIDEHYQRQSALLACVRSPIKVGKNLDAMLSDIMLRFGLCKDYIVRIVTQNIQNYTLDLMEAGVHREVLSFDYFNQRNDLPDLKQENFELLHIENNTELDFYQLDFLELIKIWSSGLTTHIDEETKHVHRNIMEK